MVKTNDKLAFSKICTETKKGAFDPVTGAGIIMVVDGGGVKAAAVGATKYDVLGLLEAPNANSPKDTIEADTLITVIRDDGLGFALCEGSVSEGDLLKVAANGKVETTAVPTTFAEDLLVVAIARGNSADGVVEIEVNI